MLQDISRSRRADFAPIGEGSMSIAWQDMVTAAIVVMAVAYLARVVRLTFKHRSGCSTCSQCSTSAGESTLPLVKLSGSYQERKPAAKADAES